MPSGIYRRDPDWLDHGPRDELIWAAGFFDGEGHFGYRGIGTPNPNVDFVVVQKDRRPLDRFASAIGAGKVYVRRRDGVHMLKITNTSTALSAMNLLWPWLSEPKREQVLRHVGKDD